MCIYKASAPGNERQDFLSEIEMMKKVAEGQNPHVVGFLGCVTIQEPLCLITEFVKFGDLLSYLRINRRMVLLISLHVIMDNIYNITFLNFFILLLACSILDVKLKMTVMMTPMFTLVMYLLWNLFLLPTKFLLEW